MDVLVYHLLECPHPIYWSLSIGGKLRAKNPSSQSQEAPPGHQNTDVPYAVGERGPQPIHDPSDILDETLATSRYATHHPSPRPLSSLQLRDAIPLHLKLSFAMGNPIWHVKRYRKSELSFARLWVLGRLPNMRSTYGYHLPKAEKTIWLRRWLSWSSRIPHPAHDSRCYHDSVRHISLWLVCRSKALLSPTQCQL